MGSTLARMLRSSTLNIRTFVLSLFQLGLLGPPTILFVHSFPPDDLSFGRLLAAYEVIHRETAAPGTKQCSRWLQLTPKVPVSVSTIYQSMLTTLALYEPTVLHRSYKHAIVWHLHSATYSLLRS